MKAAALMVLGTASHVGKSVMTAALCRIFRDDGIDVAPFKAQNMALNSFATRDGLEIGRAQAVQAEAARVPASADMNPVLLKPVCDTGSQVVLNGRIHGTLSAQNYYEHRSLFVTAAHEAYTRLASRHELVVLEGAGSPVEMNLKQFDFVNLAMAEFADAKCILVADIDRGGVFAQLVGTFSLLEPHERARFAGFVINRFRGDPALLGNAVEDLERRTGQRCLGVVPYLRDLGIAEEDSVVLDESAPHDDGHPALRVGAVLLPSLSNFSDFDALARIRGVRFEYVRNAAQLRGLDVVIIPGSKSTVRDLAYLRETGLADGIIAHARERRPVLGICGGFQMLGRTIDDPHGVETFARHVPGLDLLDVTTEMAPEKTTRQVTGRFANRFGNATVAGYEIHVGVTRRGDVDPLLAITRTGTDETVEDGAISRDGCVIGTYVHGLFDTPDAARALLEHLCTLCGRPAPDAIAHREDPYARLAAHVRAHIDVAALHAAIARR